MFLQVASFGEERVTTSKPEMVEVDFAPDHFDDDFVELFSCCDREVCGVIDPFLDEEPAMEHPLVGINVNTPPKLQGDYGVQVTEVNMARYALVLKPTGIANLEFKADRDCGNSSFNGSINRVADRVYCNRVDRPKHSGK
jgi:hypothetical protein